MKIGYLVSTLRRCGPTHQLYYIISFLDRTRFTPVIITLSPEPESSLIDQFRALGVEIITVNLSRIKGAFQLDREIAHIVREHAIELVHSQGLRADRINSRLKENVTKVCSIRNYAYHDYPMKFGFFVGMAMASAHMSAIRRIGLRVCCSRFIAHQLDEKHHITGKVIVNGVATHRYQMRAKAERMALRTNLELPSDIPVFFSAGALIKRKDPDTLLQGFLEFAGSHPALLLIAGKGPLETELHRTYQTSAVRFLGEVHNVEEYLAASDYFISASLSEGLPNAVLEALSAGVPCVLSAIEPHREFEEMTRHGGVAYFPMQHSHELALALEQIVAVNREDAAEKNRQIVIDRYSAEKMSLEYQRLYRGEL